MLTIRPLTTHDVAQIGEQLPLHRLNGHQSYFVAWEDDEPVGHAHVAWTGGKLELPEIQDVFVLPAFRRRGIATALTKAVEDEAGRRGHARVSLGHSIANDGARRLYEGLGYRNAGAPPERVHGTVLMRGRPVEVDDTIVYLVKEVAVDSGPSRTS